MALDDDETLDAATLGDGGAVGVHRGSAAPAPMPAEEARYAAGPELGRGGIGRVLSVRDHRLDRQVALKELLRSDDPEPRRRFIREARITARLEHPNIVPVHELGERPDGTPFYTMRQIEGRTLAQALKEAEGPRARLALLPALVAVCQAVGYAHSRGVVHRDLKPHNVMLADFGEVAVIDWGLARSLDEPDEDEAVLGRVMGTPAYMSPEQAHGTHHRVGPEADVWALGVILGELLSGSPPFGGVGSAQIITTLRRGEGPALQTPAGMPPELVAIAQRAMERAPEARYAEAGEMARELVAWQTGRHVSAYDYTSWELVRRLIARNPVASLAVAALGLSLAIAGVITLEARETAERGQRLARTQARTARGALAAARLERAHRANAAGDRASAAIYAAAALVDARMAPDPATGPEARGALFVAEAHRGVRFEQRMGTAGSAIGGLAFSPDGQTLAAPLFAGGVMLWDLRCEVPCPLRIEGPPAKGELGLLWEDSERLIWWGGEANVQRLRVSSGETSVLPTGTLVWSAALDLEGKTLATGHRDGVRLWSVPDHQRLGHWKLPAPSPVIGLAFSADGRLAGISRKASAHIWQLPLGQRESHPLSGRGEALRFRGSELLIAGKNNSLWRWPLGRSPRRTVVEARQRSLGLSADGHTLLVGTGARSAALRDPRDFEVIDRLHGPLRGAERVAVSPDGLRLAVGGLTPGVGLWRRRRAPQSWRLATHSRVVKGLARRGKVLYSSADDRYIRASRLGAGGFETLWSWPFEVDGGRAPQALVPGPAGEQVAIAGNYGGLWLMEVRGGALRQLQASPGKTFAPWPLRFSKSGQVLYYAGPRGALRRWAPRTGPLVSLKGHQAAIWSMARSGARLATGDRGGEVRLWQAETGAALGHFRVGTRALTALAFHRGGLLAGDAKGRLAQVDAEGLLLRSWTAHAGGWINALAVSPEGLIASGGDDGAIRIWSGEGELLLAWRTSAQVRGLHFVGDQLVHDDGTELVARRLDAQLLREAPRTLLSKAEAAAGLRLEPQGLAPVLPPE